jgi:hypothetical protein
MNVLNIESFSTYEELESYFLREQIMIWDRN